MNDADWEADIEQRVIKALAILGEAGDSVQVFVSHVSDDGYTHSYSRGEGNFHARVNMARLWVAAGDAENIQELME